MRPFQSGLDIVRKSPGRHKIAIVQTTIIDGEARLIRLTMVLAHSSGKCVSSDWQVCPFAETASPHRMGAALTNARLLRFSRWFGIAGKDDLDAADLGAAPKPGVEQPPRSDHRSQSNGHVACSARDRAKPFMRSARPIFAPDQLAILRERSIAQVPAINSTDDAAAWAHRNLQLLASHPILRSKCDASGQPHPAASVGLRRARTHVLHCTSRSYSAETSRPV